MKLIPILLLCLSILTANAQDGFVIVELFTSQGCSSCPAADKNLSELLEDDDRVLGLSFHVDYWNYIGWKDPYSNKLFSERQRQYAKVLNESVYTPQMIVNGQTVFVGSNKQKAKAAIMSAISNSPKYEVSISNPSITGSYLSINYSSDKVPNGEVLNVALVERDIENYVPKGENHGRTLHHDNVVRAFESVSFKKSGALKVNISEVNKKKSSVVLFVQDEKLKVVAAQIIALSTL